VSFKSLFDLMPGLALALDLDGVIVDANPGAEKILGQRADELRGRNVVALVPEWDSVEAGNAAQRMQRLLEFERHEIVARHAAGERRQLSAALVPALVNGGRDGYYLIARDVTRLRRTSRQLQVQADVIDHTHDAVAVLDASGCVVSWNLGATRLYGVRSEAMVRRPFEELFEPADRPRLKEAIENSELGAAKPVELELQPPRADGGTLWVLLSLARIPGLEGRRELVVVSGLDVTARRVAEDALRQAQARAGAQSQRQRLLSHATAQINRQVGSDGLLQRIADDVRLVVGAHQARLQVGGSLPDADVVSLSDKYASYRGCARRSDAALVSAAVLERRTPVLLSERELQEHPQWRGLQDDAPGVPPLRGWLALPVFGRDGAPIGLLQLSDKLEGEFDLDDLAVAQQIAQAAAVAIESDALLRRANAAEHRLLTQRPQPQRSAHDALTGLPDRALLQDRMRQALALARRANRTPALLVIDLDHFREVNESLGHDAGDQVLLEVVVRLKGCLRSGDTLSRLGADEFMALLPDLARPEDASLVAEKIQHAVAQPYLVAGQTVFCSCSIGVAVADKPETDPTQLLQQAGLAVHAAKRAGRHAVQFFSGDLAQRVSDRLEMRSRLQSAIANGEFELHYQPQLELHRNRISGVEALLRWRQPQLGWIEPQRFVPVAEDTGQILAIGEWVLEQACAQHRRWIDSGLLDCPVAVNVSGVQFRRDGFVEGVAAVLERTGLAPHRLELELTESVMMETGGKTLETLTRLRTLGVSLSIDDFGTGFSSLGYLKRLPIDKVKIDRSFVTDITHDSGDAAITLSVIAIAHHLRLRVVAEGVETPAQLAYLKRHLCDEVQGYLVSRPVPASELETFLAGYRPPEAAHAVEDGQTRPTLLLVDDEPNVLRALTRTLRRDGYRILTADGAADAFQILAQNEVHVILSDQRMPDMCGTDFLSEVKSLYPQTVRIVLSGYTDLQSVTEAINRGAIYRFLTKPWEDEPLRAHIKEAFLHQQRERA